MAVLYVQVPHRGKLLRAGCVQDLQDTWCTVHLMIIMMMMSIGRIQFNRSDRHTRHSNEIQVDSMMKKNKHCSGESIDESRDDKVGLEKKRRKTKTQL